MKGTMNLQCHLETLCSIQMEVMTILWFLEENEKMWVFSTVVSEIFQENEEPKKQLDRKQFTQISDKLLYLFLTGFAPRKDEQRHEI